MRRPGHFSCWPAQPGGTTAPPLPQLRSRQHDAHPPAQGGCPRGRGGSYGMTRQGSAVTATHCMAGDGMAPRPDAPAAGRDAAAAPDAAAAVGAWPPRRRGRKRTLVTAAAAVAVVVAAGVAERSAVAGSVAVLGHLRWAWMPAVIML